MKTVLITGCSSGFGLEIAKYFLQQDWKVIATMRTPRADILPESDRLKILPLDVTKAESIRSVLEAAGPIDALVNNAGIGMMSAVEATPMDTVREVFETNTFGTIAMAQAYIPQFRERRTGVIVNVTSSVAYVPMPLLSIYRASKAAVDAFTESLAAELREFGVRATLVLPGRAPSTSFIENGQAQGRLMNVPEAYKPMVEALFAQLADSDGPTTESVHVAEAVWKAVNDPGTPLWLPAGPDAEEWHLKGKQDVTSWTPAG